MKITIDTETTMGVIVSIIIGLTVVPILFGLYKVFLQYIHFLDWVWNLLGL